MRTCITMCIAMVPFLIGSLAASQPLPSPNRVTIFDWPSPSWVRVRERETTDRYTREVTYVVLISRIPSSTSLRLDFVDHRIISLDGKTAKDPGTREIIAKSLPAWQLAPSWSVSVDGRFSESPNLKQLQDPTIEFLNRTSEDGESDLEEVFRSSKLSVVQTGNMADIWRVWVEDWLGIRVEAGFGEQFTESLPVAKPTYEIPWTRRSLGPDPANPGLVKFTSESTAEGPGFVADFNAFCEALTTAKSDLRSPRKRYVKCKRTTESTIITHPRTLQPKYVEDRSLLETVRDSGETERISSHRIYWFEWPE